MAEHSGQSATTFKIVNKGGHPFLDISYELMNADKKRNAVFAYEAARELAYIERKVSMMSDLQVQVEYHTVEQKKANSVKPIKK